MSDLGCYNRIRREPQILREVQVNHFLLDSLSTYRVNVVEQRGAFTPSDLLIAAYVVRAETGTAKQRVHTVCKRVNRVVEQRGFVSNDIRSVQATVAQWLEHTHVIENALYVHRLTVHNAEGGHVDEVVFEIVQVIVLDIERREVIVVPRS